MKSLLSFFVTFLLSSLYIISQDLSDAKKYSHVDRNPRKDRHKNDRFIIDDIKSCQRCGFMSNGRIPVANKTMVIGGEDVDPPYKYPWMVALQKDGQTFCGGSLISDRYIVTAAHCIQKQSESGGKDYYDEYDYDNGDYGDYEEYDDYYNYDDVSVLSRGYLDPGDITVAFLTRTYEVKPGPPVEAIIPHRQFSLRSLIHDIGLIKLSSPITCNELRNPICLPDRDYNVQKYERFTIAGWGRRSPAVYEGTKYLQETDVMNIDFKKCLQDFPCDIRNCEDHYYCLIGKGGRSPCHGDSGGPLFKRIHDKFYLFGITSMHASTQCKEGHPFIYTALPQHLRWIKKRMRSQSTYNHQTFNDPFFNKPLSRSRKFTKNRRPSGFRTRSAKRNKLPKFMKKRKGLPFRINLRPT